MPRILILGATGSLGTSLAQALLHTGLHTIYGIARSAAKSPALAAAEIIPIVCADPAADTQPPLLPSILKNYRIDVVVDATAAYGESVKFLEACQAVSHERLAVFASEGIENGPRLGYVYTSGCWVHGEPEPLFGGGGTGLRGRVSDTDAVGTVSAASKPLDVVGWRPELERKVLACRDTLDVLVVRPGVMYGRGSGSWGAIFGPVMGALGSGQTKVTINVAPRSMSALVHVDDAASAICLGIEKLELLRGGWPVFDLVSSSENVLDVVEAFVDVVAPGDPKTGKKRLELELAGHGGDAWMRALGATVLSNSSRAKQLLGWEPKRVGFAANMPIYAMAWQASQK